MARLLDAIVVAMFLVLILGGSGDGKVVSKRDIEIITWDQFVQMMCQNNYDPAWVSICGTTTTTTTSTTTTASTSSTTDDDDEDSTTTTPVDPSVSVGNSAGADSTTSMSASVLQRATWCQLPNGTYVSKGYTFMHTDCTWCQCIQSHAILCSKIQCMATYCIDGSTPAPKIDQCCPQCAYENTSTACIVNGVSFPHGTLLGRTTDNAQCWCQLGGVECRKGLNSAVSSSSLWGTGSSTYIIVIVICILLILGTVTCCGGALLYYYYYKHQQQSAEQAYAEYYNSAGWQPVGEDGQVVEGSAEAKQAEAEQSQYQSEYPTGNSEQYIPPPYALYNGSYVNEQVEKDQ